MDYGTGSCPLPPHGLQLNILFSPSQKPLKGPCFCNASKQYDEHVGVYLQEGGKKGLINIW